MFADCRCRCQDSEYEWRSLEDSIVDWKGKNVAKTTNGVAADALTNSGRLKGVTQFE